MDKLREIEERWAKATPGQWHRGFPRLVCDLDEHYPADKKCDRQTGLGWHVGPKKCHFVFSRWEPSEHEIWAAPDKMVGGMWDYDYGGIRLAEDAEAVAAAPADVAWLIAEVKRLRGDTG